MLLYIIDLCLAFLFQYHRPIVLNKERHNTLFINAFIQISIYPLYEVTRKCTFLYLTLCPLSEYENDNKWDKLKA